MKIFLSHSSVDKEPVTAIGKWLIKKGYEVWLDQWQMTPGDSLIAKIGDGILGSDKLIVFLTPDSTESNWVKKELATGLILEINKQKGGKDSFIIPCKLKQCQIPILLIDKLYADFTNKGFESGCQELLTGIEGKTNATNLDEKFENRIIRLYQTIPINSDCKYGLTIEFAVKISPTNGIKIGIDTGSNYSNMEHWFNKPNNPLVKGNFGAMNYSQNTNPPILTISFGSPNISTGQSLYIQLESNEPFNIKPIEFFNYDDNVP